MLLTAEVRVPKLPTCDFCSAEAEYDGKTVMGPWAYMCRAHFEVLGVGLGLGKGQRLVKKDASAALKPTSSMGNGRFSTVHGTAPRLHLRVIDASHERM